MSKREDIDQLRHDYFMLSRRVEALENAKDGMTQKSYADIQRDWHARNSTVLQNHDSPKINDLSKGHWIPTPGEAAPKPYAHPNC